MKTTDIFDQNLSLEDVYLKYKNSIGHWKLVKHRTENKISNIENQYSLSSFPSFSHHDENQGYANYRAFVKNASSKLKDKRIAYKIYNLNWNNTITKQTRLIVKEKLQKLYAELYVAEEKLEKLKPKFVAAEKKHYEALGIKVWDASSIHKATEYLGWQFESIGEKLGVSCKLINSENKKDGTTRFDFECQNDQEGRAITAEIHNYVYNKKGSDFRSNVYKGKTSYKIYVIIPTADIKKWFPT